MGNPLFMRIAKFLLIVFPWFCYSQSNYESTLQAKLNEIRGLELFDNSVVVYPDTLKVSYSFRLQQPSFSLHLFVAGGAALHQHKNK